MIEKQIQNPISSSEKTPKKNDINSQEQKSICDEAAVAVIEKINSCSDVDSIADLMDDSSFRRALGSSGNGWPVFIDKFAKIAWKENANRENMDCLLMEKDWIYNNLSKYEDQLIANVDLKENKNYLNAEIYLDFIDKLHLYSEETWLQPEPYFRKIAQHLKASLDDKKSGYFISLRGRKVYDHLITIPDYFSGELEIEEDEPHRTAEHESQHVPFEIAPKVFALSTSEGFLVSNINDYERVSKAVGNFNFHADREFAEDEDDLDGSADDYSRESAILGIPENKYENGGFVWTNKLNQSEYDLANEALEEVKYLLRKPLSLSDLTIENNEKNEEERGGNNKNFSDYRYLMTVPVRNLIEREFGFPLNQLAFREQFYFLDFIKKVTQEEADLIKNYFKKFKTNGAKAFLAMEISPGNGKKIITIGEKIKAEKAKLIFDKVAELSNLAAEETEELQRFFFKKDSEQKIPNIQLELLKRSHEIITKFADELSRKENDQKKIELLEDDLERIKTEIVFLASAMKVVKNNGEKIDLEYVKDLDFSIKDFGKDFPDGEDMKEHRDIPERNYAGDPLKDAAMAGLDDGLKNPKEHKFYSIRYMGKLVAELRLKMIDQSTYYWGSFNVDADARSVGVGNELLKRAILEEAREHVLVAAVSAKIPVGCSYVEDYGHVIDGYISDYHKSGEPLFMIRSDRQQNEAYEYRNEGKSEPIDEEHLKNQCWTQEDVKPLIGHDTLALKFDMKNPTDFEKMKKTMEKLLIVKDDDGNVIEGQDMENKYVITRYFREKKGDKKQDVRYFVFEKME